ncbi:4-hydroxy-tetrahydrodipicolinate reductase [Ralstonia solanacearum]|uniref:4-hydroxy-tetrahydrodipicolinate reductase n=1 Tax=Ralstonia solanacearum TaxID=305 RepID=UPI0005ACEA76|nr:4-hydroxy-tetrahydrodipicolinate reductase [Ralstonia solanacearum]
MKIAIAGASGRMGQMLIDTVLRMPGMTLAAALDRAGSDAVGQDAGAKLGKATGVIITDDVRAGLSQADVLIDFTRPEATLAHLEIARELGVGVVIGTTGFTAEQKASFKDYGTAIGVVWAPNMSVGVNATFKLIEVAAKILAQGYDVEIIEAHHKHKIDAPSGTALKMGEVVAEAQGTTLAERAVYAREGDTGPRANGTIGFATVRGGDIVGDHTVLFIGEGERIEITHRSNSRQSYAEGAVRAACFLAGKKGLFDMNDVLGL